jgi:hypothetical protein
VLELPQCLLLATSGGIHRFALHRQGLAQRGD